MSTGHYIGVVPSLILTRTAVSETIKHLCEIDALTRAAVDRSVREALAASLQLSARARECMRTACAAGDLTMFVNDPRTAMRHAIPAEYFDQRATAEVEFARDTFGAYELPEIVVSDPLFKLVHPYRGWVHGFIEDEFREWLRDQNTGPQAGPRLRPIFSTSMDCLSPSLLASSAQPGDGRNTQLRGKALGAALGDWIKREFDAKPGATDNLPGRDELLKLAREKVSWNATDGQIRTLRGKYASPAAKKGGARFHRKAGKT